MIQMRGHSGDTEGQNVAAMTDERDNLIRAEKKPELTLTL